QQPRRRRPTHLRETIIDHRSTPRQRRRPQRLGLLPQRVLLLLRNIHQPALESLRHRLNNQQVTEAIQQIHRKATRVVTGVDDVVDNREQDRKSTRLNSSHVSISYAVFCLKKIKKEIVDS